MGRLSFEGSGSVLSPMKFIPLTIVSRILIGFFKMSLLSFVLFAFAFCCWFLIKFKFTASFFYLSRLTFLTKNPNCLFCRHIFTINARHLPPFQKSNLVFEGNVFENKVAVHLPLAFYISR